MVIRPLTRASLSIRLPIADVRGGFVSILPAAWGDGMCCVGGGWRESVGMEAGAGAGVEAGTGTGRTGRTRMLRPEVAERAECGRRSKVRGSQGFAAPQLWLFARLLKVPPPAAQALLTPPPPIPSTPSPTPRRPAMPYKLSAQLSAHSSDVRHLFLPRALSHPLTGPRLERSSRPPTISSSPPRAIRPRSPGQDRLRHRSPKRHCFVQVLAS